MSGAGDTRLRIAVIGTGISGLSAAWLLAGPHDVTVYEADSRVGGHCNTLTVDAGDGNVAVDTGFIVCNPDTYPNLIALFEHLHVPTVPTEMSFAVSLGSGALEYSGSGIQGLFAQRSNLVRPRFWSMLRDLLRFYADAPRDLPLMGDRTLGEYLDWRGHGRAVREDHLYPMAGAIWSIPAGQVALYPARAFVAFCQNHGLLRVTGRPVWRTVTGGSREYVSRMVAGLGNRVRTGAPVTAVRRDVDSVTVTAAGSAETYDHVVIGAHADQALRMLADPDDDETRLLSLFRYGRNDTILHTDARLMPRRRSAWSSWNYLAPDRAPGTPFPTPSPLSESRSVLSVTYWMNRLQALQTRTNLFVTLNPHTMPPDEHVLARMMYEHPILDGPAIAAQPALWSLQGLRRTWFCGAWFGAGFHEDGLQSGLAVAEQLGGVRRPWRVANESGRIHVGAVPHLASVA